MKTLIKRKTKRKQHSKALADAEKINADEFMLVINEAENYRKVKNQIRLKSIQRGDIEKNPKIEQDKGIVIDKIHQKRFIKKQEVGH